MGSYRIKNNDKVNDKTFLSNNKDTVINFIKQQNKPIKIKSLLECEFITKGQHIVEYSYGYFRSQNKAYHRGNKSI